jgi:hypothetical protein
LRVFLLRVRSVLRRHDSIGLRMDIGVSAMITGSEMACPGLARLIGRLESTGDQIIVSSMQVAARRRAAAAMATVMMKGDVEGVLATLRRLGVRAVA